ncbi:hypothetical protein [Cupriavidus sp. TMH.W2]|uniref:hypothetical protein n=1 Tax=Cupriavidus sp. TMH.W2 TaxID=3434465 RepID=UPI003D7825A4
MISLVIRWLVIWGLFQGIGYTTRYEHVNALVPGGCLAMLSTHTEAMGTGCLYRDVTVEGRVVTQAFELTTKEGGMMVVNVMPTLLGPAIHERLTWRTYGLFLMMLLAAAPDLLGWVIKVLPTPKQAKEDAP